MRRSFALAGGLSTVLLVVCASAFALDPDRDIHQFAHRSWGEKDGYPGRTQALAQTTDGFLWIGTDKGLFRFDGVRFERYVPTSGDSLSDGPVRGLHALADGSLWIAYRLENKICVLRSGNVKCYSKPDGVTSNPTAIVQDHEGTIWANTDTGVIRFSGTRWERIGRDWNFPEYVPKPTSGALFVDSRGTLWVGVNYTILYLKQASRQFESTGAFAGYSNSIVEGPDGTVWMSDNSGYVRAISTSVTAKSAAAARCEVKTPAGKPPNCPSEGPMVLEIRGASPLLFDRNGGLWMGSGSGVFRVPHPEMMRDRSISKTSDALQNFSSKDGLTSDAASPPLEDREGNIWVATRDGLDQFRESAMVPIVLPKSLIRIAIAPGDGGDLWAVGSWAYVARIRGGSRDISFIPTDAFKLYRDPAGVTWLLSDSLEKWKNGAFQKVAQSPYGFATGQGTWQVAGDQFGTLWAFSSGHGFFSLDHHRWKTWVTPPAMAAQHVTDMFCDSTGRIWVSTYEGDVITMDKGTVADYPVNPDRPLHDVKAFAEHGPQAIWAGGGGGLALIADGRFRLMRPAVLESLGDVTGIVDAGNEGLWLNTSDGVIHIAADELDRALQDPFYRFRWERFDSSDGLPGQTEGIYPYPKAIQGMNGRIWFTAAQGVAWIDPKKKILRNAVPPPVSITSVLAAGSTHLQLADLRFPALTANVQISYTALSLSVPERVRFKYKLEGSDKDWQDVGTRREAFYTNLGPRHYRFRVIACNQDGVWNNVGADIEFTIAPAWFQTTWFYTLCAAVFLALLWAVYQLRLRQVRQQVAAGLEERVNERTRIARELHDTLLQSFQGAVFQFQAARKLLLRNAENAMVVVDEAIRTAEEGITEGRSAIRDLRPEPAEQRDLPQLLNAVSREYATGHEEHSHSPSYRVVIEGKQQDLSPMLQDEVYRISRELIRNAFAHAAPSHIEVEIRYDQDQLRLRFRDDGKGIDPKVLAGGQSGHFGIPGMRERAQRIGARLDFWSEIGAGTEVELTVPASMAYQKRRDGHRFRWFRKAGKDEQRS